MAYFRENWDNCEEYLPKSVPRRHKKKSVTAYHRNGYFF